MNLLLLERIPFKGLATGLILVEGVIEVERTGDSLVRTIEITMSTQLGFHLRVVARFVRHVRQFRSVIRVRKGKITADGKNIIGLLLLAAAWKSKLYIEAEGDDAEQAIEDIRVFFQMEKR